MSRTLYGSCLALTALAGCTAQPEGAARARRLTADDNSSANLGANALQSAGEALFTSERYDSSRIVLRLALGEARTRRDAAAEARAVTWLALVSWRLSDFAEARQLADQAIQLDSTNGLPTELSRAHYVRGLVALGEGDNREAADWFHRALFVAQAANDAEGTARAHGGLGLTYSYLGDLHRARESQRTARIAARALGHLRLEANGLANEAMIDIAEGDVGAAIARLDTARQLYRRDGYATGEQNALGQLATAYELMGQQDQAFTVLDSSLALARRLHLPDEEADLLRLIAGLHLQVGDYRRALRHYTDAEIRMRGQGLGANLGSVLRGTSNANLRLGNLPKAQEQLQEALRLHTASSEPLDRLDDLILAVELDYRTAGMAAAEPRLREARSLAGEVNTRGARIAAAVAEAHLADLDRDSRRVLRVLGEAAPDLASGDFGSEWLVSSLEARALARLGALDSAIAAGHRAVGAVERLRGGLASEALRSTYVADRAEVYGDLVLALLRRGRMEEAFLVADGARSRDLLQHLVTVQSGQPPQLGEGDQILRRIDQLVQRLRETEGRRPRERGESSDTADAALIEELAVQRSAYEALLVRAAQSNSRATGVLGASAANLDEVRDALGSGEVLLEYLLTADRVLIFAVNRSGLTVIQSETESATLTHRIRLVRDRWSAPSLTWKDAVPVATALYRTLIEPVERAGLLKGVKRLVIVPHGILGQVPFGALADDSTGRFLAMDYGILHLPSASAFRVLRNRSTRLDLGAIGGEGFAPFPADLPASGREVGAFQASAPGRSARSGGEATESALREALRHGGIVHVATHGVVNFRSPMFSRLELSRVAGTRAEDDGRLEVHELLGLTIRSPLVFLSGCETGVQQEWLDDPVRGTGDLTLAQAVLSAGAENVIMTLWRIDDAGAAEFAALFYRSLASAPVVEAFAIAQRGMASDARYASPYFWAGYTLSGDGGVAPRAQAGRGPSVVFQGPPPARELP